jgi:hypothetical protein
LTFLWPSLFVSLVMVSAIDLLLDFCDFWMLKASCIKHWETWYTQSLSAQIYTVLFWKSHVSLPFLNPFDTWKLAMWCWQFWISDLAIRTWQEVTKWAWQLGKLDVMN